MIHQRRRAASVTASLKVGEHVVTEGCFFLRAEADRVRTSG
jgi:hypothetical protein